MLAKFPWLFLGFECTRGNGMEYAMIRFNAYLNQQLTSNDLSLLYAVAGADVHHALVADHPGTSGQRSQIGHKSMMGRV
jgi:hypothetical protein